MSYRIVGFGATAAGALMNAGVAFAEGDPVDTTDLNLDADHIRVGDYYLYDPDGHKEPNADYLDENGRTLTRSMRSVFVTEDEFDAHVRIMWGDLGVCSGRVVKFDDKYEMPVNGTFVVTAPHCLTYPNGEGVSFPRQAEDFGIKGNYVDAMNVERRFSAENPVIWVHDDFVRKGIGRFNTSFNNQDDLALMFFPGFSVPQDIDIPTQMVFETSPEELVGQKVGLAGYSGDFFGLSVDRDGCEIVGFGDVTREISASDIKFFAKRKINIPEGTIRDQRDFIHANCSSRSGASGTSLDANINGEDVVLGTLSGSSFLPNASDAFSYLAVEDMVGAKTFFDGVLAGDIDRRFNHAGNTDFPLRDVAEEEPAAVQTALNGMCGTIQSDGVVLREGRGDVYAENGDALNAGDVVLTQEFFAVQVDGQNWRSVIDVSTGLEGFVLEERLGDFTLC